MEAVVTIGAISRAKLQSNHHHQQTNTQFFLQAGCPSCYPTNSVKALKVRLKHDLACRKSYTKVLHCENFGCPGQTWVNYKCIIVIQL